VARAQARTALYGGSAQVNQQLGLSSGIAGVVVERNLNPGQELRPDQSGPGVPALFVVSDPSSLWVQIDAREIDTGVLRPARASSSKSPPTPARCSAARCWRPPTSSTPAPAPSRSAVWWPMPTGA
jgi:cobalt-zinc-cadmium efflux system membrane fusion protein